VLNYFTPILNDYEARLKQVYRNLQSEVKLRFINKRLNDYKHVFGIDEYRQLIVDYGLNLNDFHEERDMDTIPVSLRNISR